MIGYEELLSRIPLRMPPLRRPARIKPVTRVEALPDLLAVPRQVAPRDDASILIHAQFGLKHEGVELAILHEAMKQVSAEEMAEALVEQPKAANLRRLAFVWEKANARELPLPWSTTGGNYLDMFDPREHYTGPVWEKSTRLRVNFNGLGPYHYCPVMLRDAELERRGAKVLERLERWVTDPGNVDLVDRVMDWAYLSETRDSYAIENEDASPDKARAFMAAMQHLADRRPLTESYIAALQQAVISRPELSEHAFRSGQNWLQRGGHGVLAIRYLPPPPEVLPGLMDGFMQMANAGDDVPPLIKAALVSFGFVFLHPFIDGNGRLSRLLAHHSLNYNGALPQTHGTPAILPLSVAMKKHERDYLQALETFSKPARALWDVTYIDGARFDFQFRSSPMIYGNWAGQAAAEFVISCAEAALEQTLLEETAYLQAYDQAFETIDSAFDLPNRTINLLIQWIQQNHCRMPERRRKSQELYMLKPAEIDAIEAIVARAFEPSGQDKPST
ncbi:Fic family protein [Variovorax sp.]|jgi:hypothetical protein|uniref:Fic family protein n=1 Tax=Variovorax sp. TaxID=1871043 RepID=UPI0037DA637A